MCDHYPSHICVRCECVTVATLLMCVRYECVAVTTLLMSVSDMNV